MKQKLWIVPLFAFLFRHLDHAFIASAESFLPGGEAKKPAISTYENWTQFDKPNDHTPAIDPDDCLDYALAKIAIRYSLPVSGVDVLDDSYTYYTTFTVMLYSETTSKMNQFAKIYCDYVAQGECVSLSGDLHECMDQAYAVCAENGSSAEWCYILQMKTASGSDHYVLVDHVDLDQQRLYLLDSRSQYTEYLGDETTCEKEYHVLAVYPFQILHAPGDCNSDLQFTQEDVVLLLQQIEQETAFPKYGDADHNGVVNASDAVYLAKIVFLTCLS